MFVIIEMAYDKTILGLVVKMTGEFATFETYQEAEEYAKKNCAFLYRVVKI